MEYLGIKIDLEKDNSISPPAMEMLKKHYMLSHETSPQQAYARAATSYCFGDYNLAQRIYNYVSDGWAMFASPVLSNADEIVWDCISDFDKARDYLAKTPPSTSKALPISCFLNYIPDSIEGLINHTAETRWLSVKGGGVGGCWSSIRSVGAGIKNNGKTPGLIPFLKTMDSDMLAYNQANVRRGAYAAYLDVSHPEIVEFLNIRVPTGESDVNRKCLQLHNAVCIPDSFMKAVEKGLSWDLVDPHSKSVVNTLQARDLWTKILETRFRTGEPYLFFKDTANEALNPVQREMGFTINHSNLCQPGWASVLTREGLRTISSVQEGDQIWSEDGWVVINKKWSTGVNRVYRYRTNSGVFYGTEGHRIVNEGMKTPVGLSGSIDRLLGAKRPVSKFDPRLVMDGLVVGDGYTKPGVSNNYLCIGAKDQDYFESEIKELIFNQPDKSTWRVSSELLLKRNYEREIPTHLFETNDPHSFLRGIYTANGSFVSGRVQLQQTSSKLVEQVQQMLSSIGIDSYITRSKGYLTQFKNGSYKCKPSFTINIARLEDVDYFYQNIGFIQSYKMDKIKDHLQREHTKMGRDRKITYDITDVEFVGVEETFDITVSGNSHTYWSGGCNVSNCSEIMLATNQDRTAVCCLSSLNLERYDEWKDTGIVGDFIEFLDNVLEYFITRAPKELGKAVYSATSERSLGLGTFGWHSYLQSKAVPFESAVATSLNRKIYQDIKIKAVEKSAQLATLRGEPADLKGSGMRNAHCLAIAPNANSAMLADTSPSIEPWNSNAFLADTRAGGFFMKNKYLQGLITKYRLEKLLAEDWEVAQWESITANDGSVQHLDWLSEWDKAVFKTAFEIDQRWIIEHAAQRQPFICQGQSVNIFLPEGSDRGFVHDLHFSAWKKKLKALYYLRVNKSKKVEQVALKVQRQALEDGNGECISCQG